jgi:hypothetical protein
MPCPRCGHENQPGANFCSSCGATLVEGDESTLQLQAIEEGLEREDEWSDLLAEIEDGVALVAVRRGPNAGSRYLLDTAETTAGRHPDSDIFLDDITVSRRHATFVRVGGEYRIRDQGSLNGTYVNNTRVDDTALTHGDEVQIGRFVLLFLVGGRSGEHE